MNQVYCQAMANVGYCPQFDAIIEEMSGEETLTMFARLRGLHEEDIRNAVSATIRAVGIDVHAKRPVKTYRHVLIEFYKKPNPTRPYTSLIFNAKNPSIFH